MMAFNYESAALPVREDLKESYREFWNTLAQEGTWWDGPERVAIAQESRNAVICELCQRRKEALSPSHVAGEHSTGALLGLPASCLSDAAIDAVHRVVTDQSRITQSYVDSLNAEGITHEQYVELVGVVVICFSIDEFNRALGLPLEPLPLPQTGKPSGYRPALLDKDVGFVPMVPPHGAINQEADLWGEVAPNVVRALSLVPDEVRSWMKVANVQYVMGDLLNFAADTGRAIDRAQMELVAGRVSAINECFY